MNGDWMNFTLVSESGREAIAQELDARGHCFTGDAVRLCPMSNLRPGVYTIHPKPDFAKMFTQSTLRDIAYAMQDSGWDVYQLHTIGGTVYLDIGGLLS